MAPDGLTGLLLQATLVLVPMILSLTVHEFSHAWAAKRLGDDTAERMGRLNLNPLSHADPMGTVALPLMILVANGAMGGGAVPFFGWAKPVPVDGTRFTRRLPARTGMMLVAAAGPLSNLLLAVLCAGLLSVVHHMVGAAPPAGERLLIQMLFINVGLFCFNMLPIHPLDGEKVLSGLLSSNLALRFERFNYQFGSMALLVVVLFARRLLAYPVRVVSLGVLAAVGLG